MRVSGACGLGFEEICVSFWVDSTYFVLSCDIARERLLFPSGVLEQIDLSAKTAQLVGNFAPGGAIRSMHLLPGHENRLCHGLSDHLALDDGSVGELALIGGHLGN